MGIEGGIKRLGKDKDRKEYGTPFCGVTRFIVIFHPGHNSGWYLPVEFDNESITPLGFLFGLQK